MGIFTDLYDRITDRVIKEKLDRILIVLYDIQGKEEELMAQIDDLKAAVAALVGTVSNQTTVIDSVVAAIKGLTDQIALLNQQLAEAIAAGDPVAIKEAADALVGLNQAVIDQTAKLAAAVPANT